MLKWYGVFEKNTGYGVVNNQIIKHLSKKGVVVETYDCLNHKKSLYSETGLLSLNDKPVSIYSKAYTDGLELNKDVYNILYTMNESIELSSYDILRAKQFDEIWVPSVFCQDVYSKYFDNVYLIPFGIDDNIFKNKTIEKDKFKFISVFSWSFRKGYDVLLKSYYDAFKPEDNVSLTIVSKVLGKESIKNSGKIIYDINHIKNQYSKELPKVDLIVHNITSDDLCNLYNQSDCFILPTRGEGFCLPALEAAYVGLPIIMTNHSGHLHFLNKDNATLVDVDNFIEIGNDQFFSSSYYNQLKFPLLGENVQKEFSHHMKNIYNNYEEYENKSKLFKRIYGWDKTCQLIVERLRNINNKLNRGV